MLIIWDEPKRLSNLAKHELDFSDLDLDFFAAARLSPAKGGRLLAIGEFKDRMFVTVVFVKRGTEALSVISMRPASSKERPKR